MEYFETAIKGVYIIEPKVFKDSRGYFSKLGRKKNLNKL